MSSFLTVCNCFIVGGYIVIDILDLRKKNLQFLRYSLRASLIRNQSYFYNSL